STTTPPGSDGSQPPGFEGGLLGPDGSILPPGFDATTPPSDGGGGPDGSQVVPDAADLCPVNPCSNNNVCCYVVKSANSGAFECMPSCPSGQPVECTGPQQCSGSNPVCCAKI